MKKLIFVLLLALLLGFLTPFYLLYADFKVVNLNESFRETREEVQTEQCCNTIYDFVEHYDVCNPDETTDSNGDGYIYDENQCDELLNSIVNECSDFFVEEEIGFSEESADSYSQEIEDTTGFPSSLYSLFSAQVYLSYNVCNSWTMLNLQEEMAEKTGVSTSMANASSTRNLLLKKTIKNINL